MLFDRQSLATEPLPARKRVECVASDVVDFVLHFVWEGVPVLELLACTPEPISILPGILHLRVWFSYFNSLL